MLCIAVFIFSWIHTFAHVANSINQVSLRDTPHFIYVHIFNMQLPQFVTCIPPTALSCLLIRAPLPNCIVAELAANSVCVLKSVFMNAPLQTKASSNTKSLMCDFNPPGNVPNGPKACTPYEQAFGPKKFGHGNTLFGWWTSETAITGTPAAVASCALLYHPGSQAGLAHNHSF